MFLSLFLLPGGRERGHSTDARETRRRGKGLLKLITSQWQLLGYSLSSSSSADSPASSSPEWIVTYFASTLFTPSGLDIYSRKGNPALSDQFVNKIIGEIKLLGGEVGKLCEDGEGMFRIPHDD